MATLMFWNVRGTDVSEAVGALIREHAVDVLVLVEAEISAARLLGQMNDRRHAPFWEFNPVPSRVRMFTRYPRTSITQIFDDGRVSIRNLRPPIGIELLVVGAHLPSKLWSSDSDQYHYVRQLRQDIERAEVHVGHQNTIVIGDLNLNPFDEALVAADGLHGVMDKRVARSGARIVQGKPYSFFYNPMWSRLGDDSDGPPGTYYYSGAGRLTNFYWNTFDQVLLRPSLLPFYRNHDLVIATTAGEVSMYSSEENTISLSDHLPLLITLSVEMEA